MGPALTPKWHRGDHTGCPASHSTPFGLTSLDDELTGHLQCWVPQGFPVPNLYPIALTRGAEAGMGLKEFLGQTRCLWDTPVGPSVSRMGLGTGRSYSEHNGPMHCDNVPTPGMAPPLLG